MADEYVIGLVVDGESEVTSAARSVDDLDDGLSKVAASANHAGAALKGAGKDAAKLSKVAGKMAGDAKKTAVNFGELEGAFGKLGGPVGRLGQLGAGLGDTFQKLGNTFSLGAVAAIGIGAAIAAVVVAAVAAAAAVGALGAALVAAAISTAGAAIKTQNLRQGLTGSAAAAAELSAVIGTVSDTVPLAESEVAKLGETLWKSGKRGSELETALREASLEAAGLGKNPGPELLAARMTDLDVVAMRFRRSIREVFTGASTTQAVSSFNAALSRVGDLFSQNRVEGRALQKLLSTVVDPLINGLTKAEPYAIAFFRGLIVGALDIAIFAARAAKALGLIPPKEAKDNMDALAAAMTAGKWAMYGIAVVLGVVAVAFALVVAGAVLVGAVLFGILGGAFLFIVAAAAAAVAGIVMVGKKIYADLMAWGTWGVSAAKGLIDGLVGGINAGVGAVVAAIKALASSAVAAMKSALKIASPSKVFEGLGDDIGMGVAVGVDGTTSDVQSSLELVAAPPTLEPRSSSESSPRATSGGGGKGVDLSGATFVFHGVPGAEEAVSMFEDALTRVLEGDAIAVGAA